jgi:hypothetical protein
MKINKVYTKIRIVLFYKIINGNILFLNDNLNYKYLFDSYINNNKLVYSFIFKLKPLRCFISN